MSNYQRVGFLYGELTGVIWAGKSTEKLEIRLGSHQHHRVIYKWWMFHGHIMATFEYQSVTNMKIGRS